MTLRELILNAKLGDKDARSKMYDMAAAEIADMSTSELIEAVFGSLDDYIGIQDETDDEAKDEEIDFQE